MKNSERSQLVVRHMSQFLLRDSQLTTADAQAVIGQLIRQTVDGHIAINLDQLPELGSGDDTTRISNLREALLKSHIVGSPGDYTPVVLDNSNRLYFYRYWQYEDEVARALREKAVELDDDIDLQKLKAGLDRLFPDIEAAGQRTAAAITALRRLTVVSGGPGTGKTTAVVRILSLLLEMKPELKIAVAAPTGKAAARASAAMIHAGSETEISAELRQRLPGTASTLHRLLGYRAGKNTFNQDNPLPYDVVVIDEASMVGVSMMARLLSALRKNCRLILLGDKDQLSSVEPGSVLGDICNNAAGYSSGFAGILGKLGIETKTRPMTQALQDCVAPLTHSFRFAQGGGIGQLASAIRDGDSDRALEILNDPAMPDVRLHECASIRQTHEALSPSLLAAFADYFSVIKSAGDFATVDFATIINAFDKFRLLCAHREGLAGVDGLNVLAEKVLAENGLADPAEPWYVGRPVMVTKNDYGLKLFNGDIGITELDSDDVPLVWFDRQGAASAFLTPRLPLHETVYAMTVHKSQGSEFDEVAFVLPDKSSELLGRELLYTAVTRARSSVAIYGSAQVLRQAIARQQQRGSGLAEKLQLVAEPGQGQGNLF